MKRYLIVLVFIIITIFLLSYIFYNDINNTVKLLSNNTIYLFQTGIFKEEENAINFSLNYTNSCIYYDFEYYHVIIGIAHSLDAKEILEEYYTDKNIDYYITTIDVDNTFINNLDVYEEIILNYNEDYIIENVINNTLILVNSYICT